MASFSKRVIAILSFTAGFILRGLVQDTIQFKGFTATPLLQDYASARTPPATASLATTVTSLVGAATISSTETTDTSDGTLPLPNVDTTTTATSAAADIKRRRRVFVKYHSSKWEQEWVDIILQQDPIGDRNIKHITCPKMANDSNLVRRYMESTCTSFTVVTNNNNNNTVGSSSSVEEESWCMIDDNYRPIYLNQKTGKAIQNKPSHLQFSKTKPLQIKDKDDDIFSYFLYLDQVTNTTYREYIEPLTGWLRHPLSCCESSYTFGTKFSPTPRPNAGSCYGYLRTSRTQFVYPSITMTTKAGGKLSNNNDDDNDIKFYYYDAGASDWHGGRGGPSLTFFHGHWLRHGITFDKMYCYEGDTNVTEFYKTVPDPYKDLVDYQHVYVRSSILQNTHDNNNDTTTINHHEHDDGPFIPEEITKTARKEDYVLFKLDIDSPGVEEGNIDYLLDPQTDILEYIDEFFYEFHLETSGGGTTTNNKLSRWYRNFLTMRNKGVRAHAWI